MQKEIKGKHKEMREGWENKKLQMEDPFTHTSTSKRSHVDVGTRGCWVLRVQNMEHSCQPAQGRELEKQSRSRGAER